jgi:hypothetical protein
MGIDKTGNVAGNKPLVHEWRGDRGTETRHNIVLAHENGSRQH